MENFIQSLKPVVKPMRGMTQGWRKKTHATVAGCPAESLSSMTRWIYPAGKVSGRETGMPGRFLYKWKNKKENLPGEARFK